jgi:hypothetical protein
LNRIEQKDRPGAEQSTVAGGAAVPDGAAVFILGAVPPVELIRKVVAILKATRTV